MQRESDKTFLFKIKRELIAIIIMELIFNIIVANNLLSK